MSAWMCLSVEKEKEGGKKKVEKKIVCVCAYVCVCGRAHSYICARELWYLYFRFAPGLFDASEYVCVLMRHNPCF